MADEALWQDLYVCFVKYIDKCRDLSRILWDSVASTDLLDAKAKDKHFIKGFESVEEFKCLIHIIIRMMNLDLKLKEEELWHEYYDYRNTAITFVHNFFKNTGAYDAFISGREFKEDKLFSIFKRELEEKDKRATYGDLIPLRIEISPEEKVKFKNAYLFLGINEEFVSIVREESVSPILRVETVVIDLSKDYKKSIFDSGRTPFSKELFIINLYFDRPVYLSGWWIKNRHYSSHYYQPVYKSLGFTIDYEDKIWQELTLKYEEDAYDYAREWEEKTDIGYTNWDKYISFIESKRHEFIKSGQSKEAIYLKRPETEKFKDFINKMETFIDSAFWEDRDLQIASGYFLNFHETPHTMRPLVDYIVALESLYMQKEIGELKERLSIRVANLLGKTEKERGRLRETILRAYRTRSRYIHGKISGTDMKDQYSVGNLRNILRLSLLSFYSLRKNMKKREFKEVFDRLDAVFDKDTIEDIQNKASEFLYLARGNILTTPILMRIAQL